MMVLLSVLDLFRKINMFFNVVLHAASDGVICVDLCRHSLAVEKLLVHMSHSTMTLVKLSEMARKRKKTGKKHKDLYGNG